MSTPVSPYKEMVAALAAAGRDGVIEAMSEGVITDFLIQDPEAELAYDLMVSYVQQYSTGDPDRAFIYGELGLDIGDPPQQSVSYCIDRVKDLNRHQRLVGIHEKLGLLLEVHKTEDALKSIEEGLRDLRSNNLAGARTVPLWSLVDIVDDWYERLKAGERGVPYPWPSMTAETMGMFPEELILLVARSGVGKSWALIICMLHAWKHGHKVLFVTTELSQRTIAQRAVAVHADLPYSWFRRGMLDPVAEDRYKDFILNTAPNIESPDVIGGDFDFRIETFEAAIEECKPDVAMLDGAYLLKMPGRTRIEQAANAFNELKRIAKRQQVPILVSSQFNRKADGAKKETAKLEHIGLTDVAGWNADQAYALIQTDDMRKDRRMLIKPLKVREAVLLPVLTNWDFELMDFTEIQNGGGGDADEFAIDGDHDYEVDPHPF